MTSSALTRPGERERLIVKFGQIDWTLTALLALMREIGMPDGVAAVGFTKADIPDLVDGALKQQRLLAICPRPVTADDLAGIFARSMELW